MLFQLKIGIRPKYEVKTLMQLLISSLKDEIDIINNNIRLKSIGNISSLPKVHEELSHVIKVTESNSGMVLNLALSYGSRDELINYEKKLDQKLKKI